MCETRSLNCQLSTPRTHPCAVAFHLIFSPPLLSLGSALCTLFPTLAQEKAVAERVYELRTYTTHPGRLPALNKRFKDHTMKLFKSTA